MSRGSINLGGNCPGQLSCNYLGAIFLGGDYTGVIAQEGNCPEGNFAKF